MKYTVLVGIVLIGTGFISCKSIADQERPNILFVIADDQSFEHTSYAGSKWVQTPAFDRIAKEGLYFSHAYTPNAKCAPSRAIILTGRNSWQLEAAANHWPYFPEKFRTFPEVLQSAGYFIGRTGKGWAPGIATKGGKPRELVGPNFSSHQLKPPTKAISTNNYFQNFLSFLEAKEAKEAKKPFFFWFGAHEPHRNYSYGSGAVLGAKKVAMIKEIPPFFPETESVKNDMLDYAFEIEHFDQQLKKIVDHLDSIDALDNTIIIVTSDNGMPFPRVKGQVYPYDHHLPLAIRWGKGISNPGRVVDELVSFADFAPTILSLAGVDIKQSKMQPMEGKNWKDFFDDNFDQEKSVHRSFVLIGKERHDIGRENDGGYPVRGIVTKELAYTINYEPNHWPAGNPETGYLNTDGSPTKSEILKRNRNKDTLYWHWAFGKRPPEELYDLKADPYCMNNLAEAASFTTVKNELKRLLEQTLVEQQDPRMEDPQTPIFDAYPYADKNTQNYYTRWQKGEQIKTGWVNPTDAEQRGSMLEE